MRLRWTRSRRRLPMGSASRTVPFEAIARIFRDPGAVWTIDEVAGRFGLSIGQAVRTMSDLEAIGVVRRLGDEYVPGPSAATSA
jgi:DNA-binding IclR family transcriptional regulator